MATFLFLEIFIRVFLNTELSIVEPDSYTLYKGRPGISFTATTGEFANDISFNSYGFYDDDWPVQKTGDIRILVIGDSFTAGFNVPFEENYARQLEHILQKNGYSADIMVAGLASWDTSTELKFLERIGLKFKPDIVIIQMYGNDIRSSYLRGLFSLNGNKLVDNTPVNIPLRKRFMMHMSTKSVVFKRAYDFFIFNPIAKRTVPSLLGESYIEGYKMPKCDDCNLFLNEPNPAYAKGYNLTYKLLEKFGQMSKTYNFKPALLIIPLKEQVSDLHWNELLMKSEGNRSRMLRDLNQRKIVSNAPGNMLIIDPYPILRIEDKNNSFYFEDDSHTNENGNRRIAEIIYNRLIEEGLLENNPK